MSNLKDKIKRKSATEAFMSPYDETETNDKDNKDINNDIDSKVDGNKDNTVPVVAVEKNDNYFRGLARGEKQETKKTKKVFTSFYLEPHLAEEIDYMVKFGEKGDKSKFFNNAVEKYLSIIKGENS